MKLYVVTYYDYSRIVEYLIFDNLDSAVQQFVISVKRSNWYEISLNKAAPTTEQGFYEETVIVSSNNKQELKYNTEDPEVIEKITKAMA